jgi:hypothetical protein
VFLKLYKATKQIHKLQFLEYFEMEEIVNTPPPMSVDIILENKIRKRKEMTKKKKRDDKEKERDKWKVNK